MSAFITYELHCDAEGCIETFNVAELTAKSTREYAAKQGWRYVTIPPGKGFNMARSRDYCPKHAEAANG